MNSTLQDSIDRMCQVVDYTSFIPTADKSKLIEFSVVFCDDYGVAKDSVDIGLSAKLNDQGTRTLFIEVSGILAKSVSYDTQMAGVTAASLGVAGAILEAGGAALPAGWVMAIATGGAYYKAGDVIATATSEATGEKAKIAAANIWDTYYNVSKDIRPSIKVEIPNTEADFPLTTDLTTTSVHLLPESGSTLIKYDGYSPTTGTKTSTTVSAYNTTGNLIGRTTSQHQTGDFIAVPTAVSPSSVLETLKQTQEANQTLAQDAFVVASFVGLDNPGNSNWLNTLNIPTYNNSGGSKSIWSQITGAFRDVFNDIFNAFNDIVDDVADFISNININIFFNSDPNANQQQYRVEPVVLDLDGDGVELVSKEQSHAWFNVTGDGTMHKTGWIGADDGLLVYDENGDGKITTAREMAFAMRTVADDTDLQALASEFDTNKNGWLDSGDTQFAKFRIWKDSNGSGETDAGELMTLAQAKVASVGLQSSPVSFDIEGNKVAGFATFTRTDGTMGSLADAAFAYDPAGYTTTVKTGYVQLSQSGGMYAVATNTALNLSLVTAGVDGAVGSVNSDTLNAAGKTTDVVLEGNGGNDTLTGGSGNDWLKGGIGNDKISGGDGNDTIVMDSADTVSGITGGNGFDTLLVEGTGGVTVNVTTQGFEAAVGGEGNDTFSSSGTGRVVLSGKAGNDTLRGALNGDMLVGGIGNDVLNGSGGNDIYVFSRGDGVDTIDEYETYVIHSPELDYWYSMGYPYQISILQNGNDTIQLGTGIAFNDIDVECSGNDLILALRNSGETGAIDTLSDRIMIKNFSNINSTIENLRFADDTTVALSEWKIGTVGNDTLNGTSRMYGGRGDDTYTVDAATDIIVENVGAGIDTVNSSITYTLGSNVENLTLTGTAAINGTGNELDNKLIGNDANNILVGGGGIDMLSGRVGADTMLGGAGDDTYYVDNVGDKVVETTIVGGTIDAGGRDTVFSTVSWTLGMYVEDLRFQNTTAAINGTGNSLDNNIYAGNGNNIIDGSGGTDTIVYAYATSGVTVSLGVTTAQATGGSGTDTILNFENIVGSTYADTLTGNSGANGINGGLGADRMIGGAGNDSYYIDNVGDVVTENPNEGTDTVYSSISYTLGANLENLTLTGTTAINATGNDASNVIRGNSGNNVLYGGNGTNLLYGADGIDEALYSGIRNAFSIHQNGDGTYGVDRGTLHDTLSAIESIRFDEGVMSVSYAIEVRETQAEFARFYLALFGHNPDEAGLKYWVNNLVETRYGGGGNTIQGAAQALTQSQEFQTLYGSAVDNGAFVTLMYNNVLHRAPDASGYNYWLSEINQTGDRGGMIVSFTNSAEYITQTQVTIDGYLASVSLSGYILI